MEASEGGVLAAAEAKAKVMADALAERDTELEARNRELRALHLTGRPMAEAAIEAIDFLAPFEFEVVEAQSIPEDAYFAPDWVVVCDVATGVCLHFTSLKPKIMTNTFSHYSSQDDDYVLSVVVPRTRRFYPGKPYPSWRRLAGYQWKNVKPGIIIDLEDLRLAVRNYDAIVGKA